MQEIREPYHPRLAPESNITDFLERQARERPGAGLFAVPDGAGWKDVSAEETRRRVRELARGLMAAGIGRGDRVGIMAATRF